MKKMFLMLSVFALIFSLGANDIFLKKFSRELINSRGKRVKTAVALDRKRMVALYFSASWCPPCRSFTPKLAEFYENVAKKNGLEIILVTSDRDEKAMMNYLKKMPWLAIPFDSPQIAALKREFRVSGIPQLIVLDDNWHKLSTSGRMEVMRLGNKAIDQWKDRRMPPQMRREEPSPRNKKSTPAPEKRSKGTFSR